MLDELVLVFYNYNIPYDYYLMESRDEKMSDTLSYVTTYQALLRGKSNGPTP